MLFRSKLHAELQKQQKQKQQKQLALIGISLDGNRTDWTDAVKEDSLSWDQGCDLDGWSSKTIGLYHIQYLPSNVLINPKGTIIGRNVTPEAVADTLQLSKQ